MAEESKSYSDIILSTGPWNAWQHNDDNAKSADKNKLKNAGASAGAGTETAQMTLRGYPLLKAKATVEVTGVGKGSGKWYCKTVIQEWHVNHGYLTNAVLTKGAKGDAGSAGKGLNQQASSPPTQ